MVEKQKSIEKAFNNFQKISSNVKNSKFENLAIWLYDLSKQFEKENKLVTKRIFLRFDYGTIIKVDFGINPKSELCGPHFAIVLNRFDSTKNSIITVLPLTSKNKKYYLPLKLFISERFLDRLNNILFKQENNGFSIFYCNSCSKELKYIADTYNYYKQYDKDSYAIISQITTISKDRIISPKNKYDIIGRTKCGEKIMSVISTEILKNYTNF